MGEWAPESQFEGIAYVPENDTFLLLHEVSVCEVSVCQVLAVAWLGLVNQPAGTLGRPACALSCCFCRWVGQLCPGTVPACTRS